MYLLYCSTQNGEARKILCIVHRCPPIQCRSVIYGTATAIGKEVTLRCTGIFFKMETFENV